MPSYPGPEQTATWPLVWADLDPDNLPAWVVWSACVRCRAVMARPARGGWSASTSAALTAITTGPRTRSCPPTGSLADAGRLEHGSRERYGLVVRRTIFRAAVI